MGSRVYWIEPTARSPERRPPEADPEHVQAHGSVGPLLDARGRPLTDLRISLTDRCNFRCSYCMPKEAFGPGHSYLPSSRMLSFAEIERMARIFAGLGVETIRLTGGEPLLRKGVEELVGRLSALRPGLDLAMTTNGSLLAKKRAACATRACSASR